MDETERLLTEKEFAAAHPVVLSSENQAVMRKMGVSIEDSIKWLQANEYEYYVEDFNWRMKND